MTVDVRIYGQKSSLFDHLMPYDLAYTLPVRMRTPAEWWLHVETILCGETFHVILPSPYGAENMVYVASG